MGLVAWVRLLKNLRGVVFFEEEPDPRKVKWLAQKHRYRSLGLPLSLWQNAQLPLLKHPPFVPLSFPFAELEVFKEILSEKYRPEIAEAIILSCCYCSPLLVLDPVVMETFRPFTLWELRSLQRLSEKDLLFHLRVASYAILDFFPLAEEVMGRTGEWEELLTRRREAAQADGAKRFWRIKVDPEGEIVCVYLDLLPAIVEVLEEGRTELANLIFCEPTALAFPITCAFSVGGIP